MGIGDLYMGKRGGHFISDSENESVKERRKTQKRHSNLKVENKLTTTTKKNKKAKIQNIV